MRLFNTLTRQLEEIIPYEANKIKFYTCGPTVYHYAHIGNMRNYIGHDILDKALRYLGFNVLRCMNITDVGHLTSDSDSGVDKMEKAAKRENKSAVEIAEFYTDAFFKDFNLINCRMPEIISSASKNIDMYIKIIDKLLKDDFAYISGGNIYFDTSKISDYYVLTNHREDEMVVGAREEVEEDLNKKNQADFVLWFTTSKYKNHELLWDSPWGMGYPGWHIECSGIAIKYLGEYLDIHGGGVDNIFPHHTNEIVQSEAYLGHKWCKYWFHNEHLLDDSGKMSKSKGDFLTISKLKEDGYDPIAYRFMCLNSHYRKQLLFNYDNLKQAENTLNKLRSRIFILKDDGVIDSNLLETYRAKFKSCLEDDLNTANGLTVLYDLLKDKNLSDKSKRVLIEEFDQVFSLDLVNNIPFNEELIEKKIMERDKAKREKNYELADKIRDEVLSMGFKLIDTKDKTTYIKI